MTSTPLERKVRQLDNDVQATYGLLEGISATQARQGNRLGEIDEKLFGHEARFDAVDAKLLEHDAGFQGIDGRLDGVSGQLDQVLELLRLEP